MNSFISKKISLASFIALMAIVVLHAHNYGTEPFTPIFFINEKNNPIAIMEFAISNGLAQFGVSLFFIISGFLLFTKMKPTLDNYCQEISKRVFSLLIPFVIWVTIWTGILFITHNNPFIPSTDIVDYHYNVYHSVNFSPIQILMKPFCFQFWFIGILFVMIIMSPIFYLVIKPLRGWPLPIFLIFWFFNLCSFLIIVEPFMIQIYWDSAFFFCLGGLAAINPKLNTFITSHNKHPALTITLTSCWIGMIAIHTYLANIINEPPLDYTFYHLLYKAAKTLGPIAVWFLLDYFLPEDDEKRLPSFMYNTFIIFAVHEPTQHFIIQAILNYNNSNWVHALLYLTTPITMVTLLVFLDKALFRFCPRIYRIITGHRGHRQFNVA